ncbi:MAG: hypothetical protein Q8O00_12870 [Holophaga sp.]|nr:hypothetical protein [Holophaga sp.]
MTAPNIMPTVLRRESGPEEEFVLALEPEHLVFQGHFPGNPILPGVMQVDWAVRLGTIAFGPLGDFIGINNLKFMDLVRPGEQLSVFLAFDAPAGKLAFRYEGPDKRKSSGTILFARP